MSIPHIQLIHRLKKNLFNINKRIVSYTGNVQDIVKLEKRRDELVKTIERLESTYRPMADKG